MLLSRCVVLCCVVLRCVVFFHSLQVSERHPMLPPGCKLTCSDDVKLIVSRFLLLKRVSNKRWCGFIISVHYQRALSEYIINLHYQSTLSVYIISVHYQRTLSAYIISVHYQRSLSVYIISVHYQ